MRLDIDVPNPLNSTAKIFLDGEPCKWCLVADEEEGYVVRYKLDERGLCQIDPHYKGEILKETVYGKVEIKVQE